MTIDTEAARAVVKVDGGRGFIVEAGRNRFILTAAHCLPKLPCAASILDYSHRTYQEVLGSLGDGETNVWAECLFADPVAAMHAAPGSAYHARVWAWHALPGPRAAEAAVPAKDAGRHDLPRG